MRGFAILGVIVYHCFLWTGEALPGLRPILKQICDQGHKGVQLFFLISAFTLALSIQRGKSKGDFSLGEFYRNRFWRIVPMYWISVAFYGWYGRDIGNGWESGLRLLTGATFTNGFVPGWINAPVPGGWSIMMEIYFYLALPALLAWTSGLTRAIALALACLGLQMAYFHWIEPLPPAASLSSLKETMWYIAPIQMVVFALGLVLFHLQTRLASSAAQSDPASRKMASLGFLSGGFVLIGLLLAKVELFFHPIFLYAAAFMLAVMGLSRYPWALFCNAATRSLGKASYSAYLCHFVLLDLGKATVLPVLRGMRLGDTAVFLAFTGVAILATAAVSLALYHAVETPIHRYARGSRIA